MYDLIIIGAGPGGYETAVRAAKSGLQVAVIENKKVGGTCLNEGCIPTKCLCRSAELWEDFQEADAFGVCIETVPNGAQCSESRKKGTFDLRQAIRRKDEVVQKLISGVEALLKTPGITLVEGKARFLSAHTLEVDKSDGESLTLEAPAIIIATGSVTKFLPIEGVYSSNILTSTELLQRTELPQRLCVIGGGVIGMEFASIFQSLGSQVTVIEFCKEILPTLDRDLAKRLRTSLKKKGMEFHLGAAARSIEDLPDGTSSVCFEEKGKTMFTTADVILMAVGRKPNVEDLQLENAGISYSGKGIQVDTDLQTNVSGVFAIGDVNGLCPLAHAASYQGWRALLRILGKDSSGICLDIIPSAVFTVPEFASVGLSEEACEEQGKSYTVRKAFYRANGKALALGNEEGLVKIILDEEHHILGCHILGAHSSDLIHEVTLLMSLGATIEQLGQTVHAHPTLSELLSAAAND